MATNMSDFKGAKAMPISQVQPHLKAKTGNKSSGKITYSPDTSAMVKQLDQHGFLNTRKLTFLVHGYSCNIESGWMKDMRDSMVKEDPTQTVVRLDWRQGAAVDLTAIKDKNSSFKRRLAEHISGDDFEKITNELDAIETGISNLLSKFPLTGPENPLTFLERGIKKIRSEAWFSAINDKLSFLESLIPETKLQEWFADTDFMKWLSVYHTAAATTQSVGEWLGNVARKIKEEKPEIKIQGVGHSLGAHLLGKAGRSSGAFSRITGLDPAGPDFEEPDGARDKMLRKSDADFVDVIHTNGFYDGIGAKFIPVNHLGTLIPLGTVDFYPNYGYDQLGIDHARVLDYYSFSIKNPGVLTTSRILDGTPDYENPVTKTKLGEPAEMGYHCKESSRGLYYIAITPDSLAPFVH
ncbi:phospholipase A1-like [Ptychodera flava]|uniref:phospholipase A1-like n=1 Tax=Ptychodera flava TaxID=63121 RepID=UPI003969D747